jgi:NAD-dependent DNA ligase
MEYLIGSLDDDGLLRKSLDVISDELAIYHNIDATNEEIEKVLSVLHDFDPAGIGARSLQECLLIQISRRDKSQLKTLMHKVVSDFFDEFTKKHWDKIRSSMSLSDEQMTAASDLLAGKSIVISGVFEHHSRDEYKQIIEQNGGKNVGSISGKTSFILAGDNMGPSKLQKAEKLGIPIVNEEDFLKMIER